MLASVALDFDQVAIVLDVVVALLRCLKRCLAERALLLVLAAVVLEVDEEVGHLVLFKSVIYALLAIILEAKWPIFWL